MKYFKNLKTLEDFQKYLPFLINQIEMNDIANDQFEQNQNINLEKQNRDIKINDQIIQSLVSALHANVSRHAIDMIQMSINSTPLLLNKSMEGETITHYHVLEKLGAGGMGVVYKAKDLILERFVTIKFLPPHLLVDDVAKKRFIHEARNLSLLDHPNICSIYEICETPEGFLFIVMPYYQGRTLRSMIDDMVGTHGNVSLRDNVGAHRDAPLNIEQCINIVVQIAQGLAKAHEKGVVHRDIKPENIIITEDNVVKIIDFGLSKLNDSTKLSQVGTTMGTMHYMSPQQTWGLEVDHRTDIWSLGVVLYEMLSGKLPFRGGYKEAVIYSIANEEPEQIKHVPDKLWNIVKKCLAKKVHNRYTDIREMIEDLQDYRISYLTDSTDYVVTRINKVKRKWAILVLFIMIILPAVIDWF